MAHHPLTITNPETLAQRLDKIDTDTTNNSKETNESKVHKVHINGYVVTFTVTAPQHPAGRFYGLFKIGTSDDTMKKVSKKKLITKLLEGKTST